MQIEIPKASVDIIIEFYEKAKKYAENGLESAAIYCRAVGPDNHYAQLVTAHMRAFEAEYRKLVQEVVDPLVAQVRQGHIDSDQLRTALNNIYTSHNLLKEQYYPLLSQEKQLTLALLDVPEDVLKQRGCALMRKDNYLPGEYFSLKDLETDKLHGGPIARDKPVGEFIFQYNIGRYFVMCGGMVDPLHVLLRKHESVEVAKAHASRTQIGHEP